MDTGGLHRAAVVERVSRLHALHHRDFERPRVSAGPPESVAAGVRAWRRPPPCNGNFNVLCPVYGTASSTPQPRAFAVGDELAAPHACVAPRSAASDVPPRTLCAVDRLAEVASTNGAHRFAVSKSWAWQTALADPQPQESTR